MKSMAVITNKTGMYSIEVHPCCCQLTALLLRAVEWLHVVALNILEVVYSTNLQLGCCSVVTNDDTALVHLENADCPHLCHATLNCVVESLSLVVAVNEDKNLLCIHHSTYTNCNRSLGNLVYIVVEET